MTTLARAAMRARRVQLDWDNSALPAGESKFPSAVGTPDGTPLTSPNHGWGARAACVEGEPGFFARDSSASCRDETNTRTRSWVSTLVTPDSESSNFCHTLSEDCLVQILCCLSPADACKMFSACKEVLALALTPTIWNRFCHRIYAKDLGYFGDLKFASGIWRSMLRFLSGMDLLLLFVSGPFIGQVRAVTKNGCSIGRSRSNDLCLYLDEMVSRRHIQLNWHHNHFFICDTGGVNGTYLNGYCLPQHIEVPLNLGDVVEIGWTCFEVQPGQANEDLVKGDDDGDLKHAFELVQEEVQH